MKHILILITTVTLVSISKAEYKDTMDPNGLTRNLRTDFGLVDDDAKSNQNDSILNRLGNKL